MRLNYDYQNLWKIIAKENRKSSPQNDEETICNLWRPRTDSNRQPPT